MAVAGVADPTTAVLAVAQQLAARGLVDGTSGNVSARATDGTIWVTPSSLPYETMTTADLVQVDLVGNRLAGERSPSSELALHLACYRAFPEIGGVVHSHAPHASMFAAARRPIPACLDEAVLALGGDVPVAEYALSGTPALAERAVAQLSGRAAVLLANHGVVAIGRDPAQALEVTATVERTAWVALGAAMLGGPARLPARTLADFGALYRALRSS
ncbi:class II aldolase/adducin family protein [Aciditerrimonas ferrireducens]|uniref:class II aldolase/adducin family protein n=1 Tax=Aciditerrimonas ferrireducens TaxID=667306 RepID=UPI0020059F40|nr:class II aldolase/adducin family protein [Aciditerrimonas ferrireducens]MCK4176951.1 class II aldolase/adducin family protein [Aciditerrimonas ferrireducens]